MRLLAQQLVRPAMAGVLALALSAGTAMAQGGRGGGGPGGGGGGMRMMMGGGPGGGGDMFGPPVSTRDLDTYTKILGLTPEQIETAKALVDGATTEYQPIAKSVRDKMEAVRQEFRETQDPTVWTSVGTKMAEVRAQRKKIEDSFNNDLKAILTPEQVAKWPAAERAQRRSKTLGRGLMSGERVDLFRLVERAELTPEQAAALRETLDQYELELDRELIRRNEVFEKAMEQGAGMAQAFMNGGDTTKAQEMFDKGREAAKGVRDVNRKYARNIEGLLPEDKRAKFAEEFKRESFPMIYRPSFASRVLDTAEKMTDLDENQKAGLAVIRESFTREQNTINNQLQTTTEQMEANVTLETMFAQFRDPKMQELRQSRRTLEEQTVEKVQALLNEGQRTRLPERDAGPQDGGPRGRRDGADAGGNGGDGNGQRQRRGRGQQTDQPGEVVPRRNGGPA